MNLITIQTVNGEKARSLLGYDDTTTALSAFWYTLSSATANPEVSEVTCVLMTDDGLIIRTEHWIRTEG